MQSCVLHLIFPTRCSSTSKQEGRTLRDLVIELVERGLTAREVVDPQKRFDARPVFGSTDPAARPVHFMSNAALYEIMNEDDDERAIQFMARR